MMRWLCPHRHDRRERDAAGVLYFVCDLCGRRVVAITRTAEERAVMHQTYQVPPVAVAQKAQL
jgi:tRNA(Ile2) C34 agmatinyltransferase TiaS